MAWNFHANGTKKELGAALDKKGAHEGDSMARAQDETREQIAAGVAAVEELVAGFGDDDELRATLTGHANPAGATNVSPAWLEVRIEQV